MEWSERIGRRLKLRDLHILMAVAETHSMSKAAGKLAVSLPVVSKAISDLERVLGVRLLDRGPHGVEPTAYGWALLSSGAAAFDELKRGVGQIKFLSDPTAGEVRIGCNEPFAAGLLPAILDRMGREYPRIVCHVIQTPTAPTLEFRELRERRVDLVVARYTEPLAESDLQTQFLFPERLYVVAGRKSKWARRRRIELSELTREPWLLTPPDTLPTQLMAEAFAARGLQLPQAAVVSLSVHLRNMLLPSGRYLAVLPGSLLRYGVLGKAVNVLPVDFPAEARPVGIITLKNRTKSAVAELFIKVARLVAGPLK